MTLKPVKTAIIGCGNISSIYLQNCTSWPILDVAACADLDPQRARDQAAKFKIQHALSVGEVLADPGIELIVNLTNPAAHSVVGLAALSAGKSVYNEKPLAVSRDDGLRLLSAARANGVRVGGAPDTFLGGGLQTCRRLIDAGSIGQPVGVMAHMLSRGPELWHPDPAFLYQVGAGPLFDRGPYYLTALIALLGPIVGVTGSARINFPERTVFSGPKRGARIAVETPTTIAGILEFASGLIGTLVTSFDVWDEDLPSITIYGAEGTLTVPDPNTFSGPVRLRRKGAGDEYEVPITAGHTGNSRGLGVADMAYAIRRGGQHRASGVLTFHVLDVMHAILESASSRRHMDISSTCDQPASLPAGLADQELDE